MLKDKNSRKTFFKSFFITLILVFITVGGGLWWLRRQVTIPDIPVYSELPFFNPNHVAEDAPHNETAFDVADPHEDDALIQPPFNFDEDGWERKPYFRTLLIFGYDDGLNTDTIMVAAFDVQNREAYIVSIPRDTQIDVSRNIRRINSAYSVGMRFGDGHSDGVDQLKRELQTIIGFRPDYYVSIEEDAFVRIIDAVGGVNIHVPFHMIYDDPTQNLHINLPAGLQRLDGERALHFVRFRLGNAPGTGITDFRRMEHQQQLIQAMMTELLTPRVIPQIPELIRAYRDHVNTDMDMFDILFFAEQFLLGDIVLHTYNYPTTSVRTTRWYEIPNGEEALELINRTINPFTRDLTMANLQLSDG